MKALITALLILVIAIAFTFQPQKKKKKDGGHEIATVMFTHKTPESNIKPTTVVLPTFLAAGFPQEKQWNAFGFHAGVKTWTD